MSIWRITNSSCLSCWWMCLWLDCFSFYPTGHRWSKSILEGERSRCSLSMTQVYKAITPLLTVSIWKLPSNSFILKVIFLIFRCTTIMLAFEKHDHYQKSVGTKRTSTLFVVGKIARTLCCFLTQLGAAVYVISCSCLTHTSTINASW